MFSELRYRQLNRESFTLFLSLPHKKKEKYNNSSNVFSVIRKATKDCIHKMAKNTSSSAFRKIDVDQYNEDNFKEDEADSVANTCDENLITNLLTEGKCIEALVSVLQNAPLRCKQQHVKDHALNVTLKVLLSVKASQMDQAVEILEQNDLLDVLMKYIYRGFEMPSEGSSGHLLQWHEKVFAKGGLGCICRVLADTNRA